ncbi:phosphotransferase [Streptomyces sp. NPDC052682]|uniref:phosphotransferase n=1 Tax=Streptomyces sp. NPDC052682 TaxID=3154954 RepID=UPI00341F609B
MPTPPGRLLGSGRSADVYEIDEAWVLRRDRNGWGDATAEAAVMAHVGRYGYPVPRVRLDRSSRTDLVMERLPGPTMLQACLAGSFSPGEAGAVLARLLLRLHQVPARHSTDPAVRVLHLDLHPDNVLLTPGGPRVIDWSNTEEGDPGLDWAMSAVILAQVAVAPDPLAGVARPMLDALLADPSPRTAAGLPLALRRRTAQPTMSREETELLYDAQELIRSLLH